MSLFDNFKKISDDVKKALDEANIMEKAKTATENIKKKAEDITGNMSKTQRESFTMNRRKAEAIEILSHNLALENYFKDLQVNKDIYEIQGKFFKMTGTDGGRGKIKITFFDEGETETKVVVDITVPTDTAGTMERNYKNIYNALLKSIDEKMIVKKEEFKGLYKEVKEERQQKVEQIINKGIELVDKQTEKKRLEREEQNRVSQMIFSKKIKSIEENLIDNKATLLNRFDNNQLLRFTQEYYEKLCTIGEKYSNSNFEFYSYISEKTLDNAKDTYAKSLKDNETVLVAYELSKNEGFLITNKNLYFSMKDPETDNLFKGKIDGKKIQELKVKQDADKMTVQINSVDLFVMDIKYHSDDLANFKGYIDRLTTGHLKIEDKEISKAIEKRLDKKLYNRIKGFLYEDEYLLYVAWGLDSLSARDYVICTNQQLMIINREVLGISEQIKRFEYKDIVSVSTAKSNNGGLITDMLYTAFKQCDLEIYVAGTSFRIETLLRLEAERIIKIVNEYKRKGNKEEKVIIQEKVVQPKENVLDQIEKLDALKNSGILTEEDFQAKKTELLKRL